MNTQRLDIITILLSRFLCEMTAIKMAINSRFFEEIKTVIDLYEEGIINLKK